MNRILNFNKRYLFILTLSLAILTFLVGLYSVLVFQSKYLNSSRIERAVLNAQKLSSFDQSISLERALKIYAGDLSFAFFDHNCNPIYVTDLTILTYFCLKTNNSYHWITTRGLTGEKYIIGFSGEYNLIDYFAEYRLVLISTTIIYLLFVLVLILIFFRLFIDIPISKISSTIDKLLKEKTFDLDTFKVHENTLFYPLYTTLTSLIEEIIRFNKEEEKLHLSRQIAHDLRAPLSILESSLAKATIDNNIEKIAIKRLKQISEGLMPQTEINTLHPFLIEDLFKELSITYSNIKFTNLSDHQTPLLNLIIPEIELFRYLSNIIKNSIEANATSIEYKILFQDQFLIISISDNGIGVNKELMPEILKGKTTKTDGHGLGLSHISKRMMEVNGEIKLTSEEGNGFSIKLKIPCRHLHNLNYILIDDDKLIRIAWKSRAEQVGISLQIYESVDSFLENKNITSLDSYIYIDSELKNGARGELASEKLASLGFTNIYLATGYSSTDFDLSKYPWIKGVISKRAPF